MQNGAAMWTLGDATGASDLVNVLHAGFVHTALWICTCSPLKSVLLSDYLYAKVFATMQTTLPAKHTRYICSSKS